MGDTIVPAGSSSWEEQWIIPGVGTFPSRPDKRLWGDYQWANISDPGTPRLRRFTATHQLTAPAQVLSYEEWARKQGLI